MSDLKVVRNTLIAIMFLSTIPSLRAQDDVGPGSTVEGDILRGQGQFLKGAAWYELNKAQADALNARTIIEWNREISRVYAEEEAKLNEAEAQRKAGARARKEEVKRKVAEREARLRTKPTLDDIIKGDALNALLVDLSDPMIAESSWRGAKVALPDDISIRSLVFQFAPKSGDKNSRTLSAGVIALSRLDLEGHWPIFLQSAKLTSERKAFEAAYIKVREKSRAGSLDLDSVLELDSAVNNIKAKIPSAVPSERGFQAEASRFVLELKQATRMFDAKTINFAQEMLADTQLHQASTVGELLAFMRKYRLLFANADKTPTSGSIYGQIYGLMREQSKKLDLKPGNVARQGVDLAGTEAATLRADGRFLETAKKLIQAINGDNSPAIQASFDAQMQQVLPPAKATPFFRGLVTAKGKLKEAGVPHVTGPTAIVRVTAERGAWDFNISLNPSGKIVGLLVTEAGAEASAPASAERFAKAANKLIQAINSDDSAAIQASFDAQMQRVLPPAKATPFFRGLVSTRGKLKEAGAPQVTGPTAIVRVMAERGAWEFKISLNPSGKIAGLLVTEAAAEASAPATTQRFTKVANKLIQAINSDDSAAIQASFDAQMQQALPPAKTTPFFRGLVTAKGKLKEAGVPQVTGPTAIVRVTAERGAWDFKITLDASDKISGLLVTPPGSGPAADSTVVPRSRTLMQLPFRGEWYVFGGGDNEQVNHHVSAHGQRRAADIIIKGADDLSYKGTGRRNEDYFVYGQQILAAAPGTVDTAIDGVPDNEPGSMNPLRAVGNCLIIDQGFNEYAVYAHLKPGSLRVHRGDKVRTGQVLALCGNSGNSSEPHLHFHLQDKAILQDGAGITPYFTNVKCRRGDATLTDTEYTFLQGDHIQSATKK